MKRMKQFVALLLSAIMATASLSGCAGQKETKQAEVTEASETGESGETAEADSDLYVIDVLIDTPVVDSSLDTATGKWIADNFGIAFNYIAYAGDIQEKQALMLAGGDYNEIQWMQNQTMVQQYIDAGVMLNLDDYKDILPDFYKRFEELIPYWRAGAKDGGLYKWENSTPAITDVRASHNDVAVRTDVLEYYGWPELVTASDWKEFLEKAVKDFPTTFDGQATVGMTLPAAEPWGMQGIVPCGFAKGGDYVGVGNDYYIYNNNTETFEDFFLNPGVKESFQFFNDLYRAGVLDEECFTDTSDATLQKMQNGSAIAVWYVTWNATVANQALEEAGHPEMSYIQMPFQLDSQEGQKYTTAAIYSYPFRSFGVTKNCKDPERVLKFINWCCTDEGQILLQSGIEGVHYTIEDGVRVPTDLFRECFSDANVSKQEGLGGYDMVAWPHIPLCFVWAEDGAPYNMGDDWKFLDEIKLSDRQKEAYAGLGWDSSNTWWTENVVPIDAGYGQSCALDVTSDLGKTGAKMVETRVKYSANLVMADDFEAVWNEAMAEYDKLDHEAVMDAINEVLEGYKNGSN